MRCEEYFIIMKLIWHRYLVFSLNNCAYKISTEISLRIIRISKRTSTKKTNQRDYISSKLDQVLNNHHLSRSSASGPGIILLLSGCQTSEAPHVWTWQHHRLFSQRVDDVHGNVWRLPASASKNGGLLLHLRRFHRARVVTSKLTRPPSHTQNCSS